MNVSAGLEYETGEMVGSDGLVIAIDGPSGSGKSSTSRGVASALGLRYLDTGATYRALTWWMLRHGVDVCDPVAVAAHASAGRITVGTDPLSPWTEVDGTDVSAEIRSQEVTAAVSAVASVPEVRTRLIALQRDIIAAATGITTAGIVAEGRDIGTVVAPDAEVKVFLTASGTARASRRALEADRPLTETRGALDRRDSLDAAQSAKADGAIVIDSTSLTLSEVVAQIVSLAHGARRG